MSVAVLLAAAMLHEPTMSALIAILASVDVGEFKGRISLERALFNRSQVALAVAFSSLVMHVAGLSLDWPGVVLLAALGMAADCLVNIALVAVSTVLSGRATFRKSVMSLFGPEPAESIGLYASMCLVAPLLALIYASWGGFALLLFTVLVVPFRMALVKVQELGKATRLAILRQAALERAQLAMDRERIEERRLIAGDLHDEVLPALFQVHLMGEVLKQDLVCGRLLELDEDLPALLEATEMAQSAVRLVVRGLRLDSDPIRDLGGAIRACAENLEGEGRPRILVDVEQIDATDSIRRTLLQVSREAMVNSSRYSRASCIRVSLRSSGDTLEMDVSDDGVGFDPASVDRAAHFGLQLMGERVRSVGGELQVTSTPGLGTLVTVRLPMPDTNG